MRKYAGMGLKRIITWLVLLLCSQIAFAQSDYQFYNMPQWVHYKKPGLNQKIPLDRVKDGSYFILADNQIKVSNTGKVDTYSHYVEYIVNQNGLKNSSQISIDFDPAYQAIFVHKLQVWRKGKIIDKRSSARVTLIQPEREAKDLIYNGKKSLNIILDDIRIGDSIEYSYSRNGINPVYDGRFDEERSLQWAVPVGELYQRIIWQKEKPLYFKRINTDVEVKQLRRNKTTEYIIETRNVPAISLEKGTPDWFSPYASVYFSEIKDWQDVAKWGHKLFTQAIKSSQSIHQLADKIKHEHHDKLQQVAAALQYVQANVRYLGLEIGENTHRPTNPDVTLKRRYGDCKDKASLYIALLREMGITAYPVLVNTIDQHEIYNRLPAYGAFNHAIVKVIYNNKHYWFDPTREYQLGSVLDIFQPDYGYALVLQPGSQGLESMKNVTPVARVVENDEFYLDIKQRDKVRYEVKSNYYGLDAEYERDRLASSGLQKMQKNYLNFYKNYYPGIKTVTATKFNNNSENGALITNEKYAISDFWEHDKKRNKFHADFYASNLATYLKVPKRRSRKYPYAITYPINLEHNIIVNFSHDNWSFKKESFNEDNDFFHYESDVFYDKAQRQLKLKYIYSSKNKFVPASRYKEYLALLKRAHDDINYGIAFHTSETSSSNAIEAGKNGLLKSSLIIAIVIYVFLMFLAIVLWKLAEKKHPANVDTKYYPVSVPKFLFMWLMTFGLYGVYWFYKNYSYVKRRDDSSIMPAARGIFDVFWYYPLYKDLTIHKMNNTVKATMPPLYAGGVLAVLFIVSSIIANKSDEYFLISLIVSGLLIVPMVNYIYHINNKDSEDSRYNSRFSFRHVVVSIISIPILLLVLGSEIGMTSVGGVVTGDKLYNYDLKFMQRKGILNPGDKIDYFYSDTFIFIHDDGNGFTNRHVFSYWNEDGKLQIEKARFDEIKNIDITWGATYTDNTAIKIVRKDDTFFLLYVARKNKMDRVFGRKLMRQWKKVIKS